MKHINDKINEELNVSKSFIINMEEIDYDRLIEFLQDMQTKNAKRIKITIKRGAKGKWIGCEVGSNNDNYNYTELSNNERFKGKIN